MLLTWNSVSRGVLSYVKKIRALWEESVFGKKKRLHLIQEVNCARCNEWPKSEILEYRNYRINGACTGVLGYGIFSILLPGIWDICHCTSRDMGYLVYFQGYCN